jgi:iron complex outermembrane receptor protein
LEWEPGKIIGLQATGYFQHINDYIFLEPQNEFEETVRGAFPVFLYEQTDALIYGTDVNLSIHATSFFKMNFSYAIVRGEDQSQNIPLVYMPADNLTATFSVLPKDSQNISHTSISLTGRYVWEQTRLLPDQDFLAPPPAYFLLGFNASTTVALKKNKLGINLRVENMLNTTYRDYLNRLRYFADEMGMNISVGVNYSF